LRERRTRRAASEDNDEEVDNEKEEDNAEDDKGEIDEKFVLRMPMARSLTLPLLICEHGAKVFGSSQAIWVRRG